MVVMSRGLYGQKYSGYFADNLNFFNTAAYIGSESTFTSISLGDEGTSYSWKWYGFIIASSTGTYTFQTTSDDASYVYIDGTQVVDNGGGHGARLRTGTIDLILGKRYRIQIYFGEGGGAASMIFEWSGGSQTTVTTDLTTDVLQFYPQADTQLPINYGLVGWYKGEAWNGTSWPDLSGNGNDCTVTRGTINKSDRYIYGGTGDGIQFPDGILPSTYTLFHVARYNGSTKERIFDGTAGNWLSGFHGSKAGVTYHGYWLTATTTNFPVDQILISTDQRDLYRGNGIDLKISSGTSQSQTIGINYGSRYGAEPSDWAVWEVIVYDRELSLEEIENIENYLFNRHLKSDIVHRGKNLFQPRDIVFYRIPSEYQNVNQMNADITNITNFGNVIATVSSRQATNRNAAKAFNSIIASDDGWRSAVQYSSGIYTGSASLGGYDGEWIKIQFPTPLFLYSSRIHARPTFIPRLTKTGHIIASNDDINWVRLVDIIRNDGVDVFYSDTSYLTTPYCFYAIVTTSIESTEASVNIGEWFLYTRKIEYNPIDINNGLQVHLDATVGVSYPGSGTTWYDISGKGRHGTWSAFPNYVSGGWFNTNGLECTGPASNSFGITNTSGYTIFITWYQYSLTSPKTFQFYRTGTGNANRGIYSICTWSNGRIYFDQGGCCSADTRTDVACPNPTGTWHTTALVRETNSSTRHIYIDGVLRITNTATAVDINLDGTAVNYVGPGGAWDARLKCFLAYNRGLSASEITELHNRFRV